MRRYGDTGDDGRVPGGAAHLVGGGHPGTPMQDDGPAYGLGAGGRPLWSERDRDAERIRALLRRAGCGGFIVSSDEAGVFLVRCVDPYPVAVGRIGVAARVLTRAGMTVAPRGGDTRTLRVRVTS
ncbi:hypothetical protein [Nonomuraea sp. NPDC049309]|uniref:hypothetical protein n=1 Tax=Nonomuraea sp. NPDC049309 TaxID=3364350 RepID=UPI00371DA31A